MAIKNSKTVALERGVDLTTLFGMVGRYGPALALAITAMLGVWTVFIIYRTVRGRRKPSDDDITEKDAVSPPGVTPEEEEEEEEIASCEESTEASDEGLPEMLGSKSEGPQEDVSGTSENSDLSAEESDADWLAVEECHPGSPPENRSETSEHLTDQEEPVSRHFLRGKIDETGRLTGTEAHSQTEQRPEEVGLADERRLEGAEGEEPESNHPHADNEDLQEGLEHPRVVLGDTDLEEPQPDQAFEEQEVEISGRAVSTNETTFETDTGAIVKDLGASLPQADSDHSPSAGYVEYYKVSDVCQPEKDYVVDPGTSWQAENWTEAMIGPPVDQSQLKEQQESLKEDEGQDSLHHGVIDQLNELMEDIISNLTDQLTDSKANDGNLIDPSDEVTFEDRITGLNDQPGELLEAGDSNGIDPQTDQTEAQITRMIDQLMEPTEVKNPIEISEMKGESVDKLLIIKEVQESYEKTEINIMEATMDHNEWMSVGTADCNIRDLPWLRLNNWSWIALSESEPRPANDQQDLRDVTAKDADRAEEDPGAAATGDQGGEVALAVRPLPQTVRVSFWVHYLTPSPRQTLAVTGNRQELGNWESFVPLERSLDGFWAGAVSLPAESQAEWKFVLVEEGRVQRWEECRNRHLDTGHGEDVRLHEWWGFL